MKLEAKPCLADDTDLGEGPLWSVREQALYWLDCTQRTVLRHDFGRPGTGTTRHKVSGMPGCIAMRQGGGLIAAFRTGLALIDLASGTETKLPSGIDFGRERFNDGKCDRRGRFFAGTMHKEMTEPKGALYRIDADHSVSRVADGITLSNGIAWSPDNRTLYQCDSRPGLVYAYDYDIDTGRPGARRVLIDFSGKGYHSDGCTVDAEGHLWVAEVGGGSVGRYAPDGTRVGEVLLPVSRVSSVTFGGADLRTLFITTMRYRLTPEELAAQPLAGQVFSAKPGVQGIAEVEFAG